MYNFFVDVLIWSFAIYGLFNFLNEFALDFVCYIIEWGVKVFAFLKKIFLKRKY